MTAPKVIEVATVIVRRAGGEILTVRKCGTTRFMLPGGKPEAGETPARTAVRECEEEVGLRIDPHDLRPLGTFTAAAANEPDREVRGTAFVYASDESVTTQGEIVELRWLDPEAPLPTDLAPLLEHQILPALRDFGTR